MGYWKNIVILLFTLGITIIPMTGKIWSIKERKVFWRGWLFIFLAICSLTIGYFQLRQDFKEQEARDTNQISVLKNTENIIGNLNSSMYSIENKLLRIEKLNIRLDSLDNMTRYTINRRDEILMNYNKLNSKLENLYVAEKIKLKAGIPVVNIFEGVKWIKDKDIYKITMMLSNSGDRTASELFYNVWFFNTSNDKILNLKLLSNHLIQGEDLLPVKRTDYNQQLSFPNFPLLSPLDSMSTGYVWVNYHYKDIVLDTTIYKSAGYMWRGIKLDGFNWISMPTFIKDEIIKYAESKRIKL